jgi:hypothetical protein
MECLRESVVRVGEHRMDPWPRVSLREPVDRVVRVELVPGPRVSLREPVELVPWVVRVVRVGELVQLVRGEHPMALVRVGELVQLVRVALQQESLLTKLGSRVIGHLFHYEYLFLD